MKIRHPAFPVYNQSIKVWDAYKKTWAKSCSINWMEIGFKSVKNSMITKFLKVYEDVVAFRYLDRICIVSISTN